VQGTVVIERTRMGKRHPEPRVHIVDDDGQRKLREDRGFVGRRSALPLVNLSAGKAKRYPEWTLSVGEPTAACTAPSESKDWFTPTPELTIGKAKRRFAGSTPNVMVCGVAAGSIFVHSTV